jgi:hypothetical protein
MKLHHHQKSFLGDCAALIFTIHINESVAVEKPYHSAGASSTAYRMPTGCTLNSMHLVMRQIRQRLESHDGKWKFLNDFWRETAPGYRAAGALSDLPPHRLSPLPFSYVDQSM